MRLQSLSLELGGEKLTPVTIQHGRSGWSGAGREVKIPFLHYCRVPGVFSTPILTGERVPVVECTAISSILYTSPCGWFSYWAVPPCLKAVFNSRPPQSQYNGL